MILRRSVFALVLFSLLIGMSFVPAIAESIASRDKSTHTSTSGGMTPEEESLLSAIDIDHAWTHLEYLGSLGEKAAGSPLELSAQQYVYDCMMNMDLDRLEMESFPTKSWRQQGTAMRITSPEVEDIQTTTYGGCYSIWGTEDGEPYYFGNSNDGKTLIAQVVDVGRATLAELEALGDLGGAITLVFRDDNVIPYPRVTIEEIALHGASAAIFYGYYDQYPAPDGIKQDSVGGSLPAFSISKNSAQRILDLLKHDPVTVQIDGSADLYSVENAQSANVVGYMYGSVHPDEYIVFSAHIDTWWSGTNDDCSGVAAVLEYARLFSEARSLDTYLNERTLVFCSFGAEEFGGPSDWYDWIVGSYEFVCSHPEISSGLVLHLNADMIGSERTSQPYWLENSWEINDFVKAAIADSKVDATWCYPVYPYTDSWSFGAIGGGSTVWAAWVADSEPYYHTQLDDITQSSPESMTDMLDLFGLMATRSDRALVLPIDFIPTLNWIASGLMSQIPSVPSEAELFDRVCEALGSLREQTLAANGYADDLRDAYDDAQTDEERADIVAKAAVLNDALIDARRIINSWTIGQGGSMGSWDVFVRTGQHVHDYVGLSDAISDLSSGSANNALSALQGIYTMDWAPLCSLETYNLLMSWMINDEMYWADDFDQQQEYLDVYWVYLGLVSETLTDSEAQDILEDMREDLLIPWLQEDLLTLEWAWMEATGILAQVQI
jgi:Zn-dependent M28 family amino/carboxypeptidase